MRTMSTAKAAGRLPDVLAPEVLRRSRTSRTVSGRRATFLSGGGPDRIAWIGDAARAPPTKPFVLTIWPSSPCMSIGMLLAVVPVYAHDELGAAASEALAVAVVTPMVLVCQPLAGRFGDRVAASSSSSSAARRCAGRRWICRLRPAPASRALRLVPEWARRSSSSVRRRRSPTLRPRTGAARR